MIIAEIVGTAVLSKGTEKIVDMGTTWLAPRFTAGMKKIRAKFQEIKDKMTVQSSKVADISDSAIMEMRERMELKISAISNYDSRIEVPAEKEMGNVVTLVFNRDITEKEKMDFYNEDNLKAFMGLYADGDIPNFEKMQFSRDDELEIELDEEVSAQRAYLFAVMIEEYMVGCKIGTGEDQLEIERVDLDMEYGPEELERMMEEWDNEK